jgi:hypothetical protein
MKKGGERKNKIMIDPCGVALFTYVRKMYFKNLVYIIGWRSILMFLLSILA